MKKSSVEGNSYPPQDICNDDPEGHESPRRTEGAGRCNELGLLFVRTKEGELTQRPGVSRQGERAGKSEDARTGLRTVVPVQTRRSGPAGGRGSSIGGCSSLASRNREVAPHAALSSGVVQTSNGMRVVRASPYVSPRWWAPPRCSLGRIGMQARRRALRERPSVRLAVRLFPMLLFSEMSGGESSLFDEPALLFHCQF